MRVLKCDICGDDSTVDSDMLIVLHLEFQSEGIKDVCVGCKEKISRYKGIQEKEASKEIDAKVKAFIQRMTRETI